MEGFEIHQRIKEEQQRLYLWEQPLKETLNVILDALEPIYRPPTESEPIDTMDDPDQLAHRVAMNAIQYIHGLERISSGTSAMSAAEIWVQLVESAFQFEKWIRENDDGR